jgi:hypothetical protein
MTFFSQDGLTTQISTSKYLDLLEFKVDSLKKAKELDSSWNYGIEELELEIEIVKQQLKTATI